MCLMASYILIMYIACIIYTYSEYVMEDSDISDGPACRAENGLLYAYIYSGGEYENLPQ